MKQEQRIRLEIALATFILLLSMVMVFNSAASIFELTSVTTQDYPTCIQEEPAASTGSGEGAA
ncbi:hypothetical protein [Pseudoflavonifractor phocaeensis]|uniref:hypothetical protein n=1 Tax=Pseudoflavonifractor phocaeensis TaxID=1870988 RepID=UPI0021094F33|nr:hypothetical protein [Pseudoflavonifractor phocaeensis]MCQ4862750.1 hypothetical protein [Pseudoflavonifractor phocaeensis]